MIFNTRNVRAYKLPLLVVLVAGAALLTLPGMAYGALRRQLCGVRF